MDMLERRVTMLGLLQVALGGQEVRCGSEPRTTSRRCSRWRWSPPATACRSASLGAVSVIGPLRMDYPRVISVVRDAAAQLSRFVAEVYDER